MASAVLPLLEQARGQYISGEEMSRQLGISRAAVWKQIRRLRDRGYKIEAVTNLGYRLVDVPESLDQSEILACLGDHPWHDTVHVLDTVDSTNSLAKREAMQGAPDGSVYLSDEQTGGRGRQGRGFLSPKGKGLYLSVLLRPACSPAELSHVTAMAAVAVCNAVEQTCGVRPGIKWTNDLILGEKKCVGILSELGAEWESGTLEYLVIGIGVNCGQGTEDFPEELRHKATSILLETGQRVDRNRLAAALIQELGSLSAGILTEKQRYLRQYARDCLTIGCPVRIIRTHGVRDAFATGIDENGALLVRYDNGETGVVFSGEVSVRGRDGYL